MSAESLGNQLMRLEPTKRRCPQCLGPLGTMGGCEGRGVPLCEKCGLYPRGKACDVGMRFVLDSDGVVAGLAPNEGRS